MDIQKKPTLAEKQAFWAEQLPKFESKYWLPSHFEFLVFDMDQGNYVIKDGLDPTFDDDATEIWHRVNTGWAMWKKAINFTQAQAVPEGFAIVSQKDLLELTIAINAVDLATHTESKTNEVREMWQQVALKLMALGTTQEPAND